jgi:hypothetical protein
MGTIDRKKVEDWLTRCRWLATTELEERTRARLDRLIGNLEQDLEGDGAATATEICWFEHAVTSEYARPPMRKARSPKGSAASIAAIPRRHCEYGGNGGSLRWPPRQTLQ